MADGSDRDAAAEALELVQRALSAHLDPVAAEELLGELRERRDALGGVLTGGVNPPRTDFGRRWEDARAEAYAATEQVGAVHVELGTWTAFPPARVRELVAGDGLAEFVCLDADARYDADVIADATALPFRSGTIDRVGSNSTVEHIAHPHRVFSEIHRVLRPGGIVVTAAPFVWHEHGYPDDYVRLTRPFFERVLTEIGFVDVETDRDGSSGLYYTLHNAAKMASVDDRRPQAAAARELHALVVALLGTLIPLDREFPDGSREWYHSVRVLARKPGTYEPSHRADERSRPFAERALDLLADPQTKQPLERIGGHLVCEPTGTSYAVTRAGAVNFLEPTIPRTGTADRAREAARRARGRLRRPQ